MATETESEGWCIFYDDGSTFSSKDGPAEMAPLDGVQAIVEWLSNGSPQIHEGCEFYFWTGDCWAYGAQSSLERWLRKELPKVKYGRFTSNAVHKAAVRAAGGSCSR